MGQLIFNILLTVIVAKVMAVSSSEEGGGWMHHLFIYLFICWSNRMVAPIFCCHFTAICTSKADISASVIYYLWKFFLIHYYISRFSYASLAASAVFLISLISLCSVCCHMHSANDSEVVDCEHAHTLFLSLIFL